MTIQALKRVCLIGSVQHKAEALNLLQQLGCMHLTPLRPVEAPPELMSPEYTEEARRAIRYLTALPQQRRQLQHHAGFDMSDTVSRVLINQRRLRDVIDRRDALQQRIQALEPWGDFSLPALEELGGQRLWFYVMPHRERSHLQSLEIPWQVVHEDNRYLWVVLISPEEPDTADFSVARIHTGSRSISALNQLLEDTELEYDEVLAERHELTRWIYLMSRHMTDTENESSRLMAENHSLDVDGIFAIEGWVPSDRGDDILALAETLGLAILVRDPRSDEHPPTLLDNDERLAAGEDLVAFYQMPSYWAWDPSRVLFFSFALFFSMILSDAGYALVLGVVLGMSWRRLARSPQGIRMRRLALLLVSGSLIWGALVGSYFGIAPDPDSLLGHLYVLDLHDFPTMMRISVGIGVGHLVVANTSMLINQGLNRQGRAALAWSVAALAAYALWLAGDSHAAVAQLAGTTLATALAAIVVVSSDRPWNSPRGLMMRIVDGLTELTSITKLFGDVLSYLRLFALGLASASLALTFNDLAIQVRNSVPGLGLLLALLILLAGHLLNLALGVMSGVVHGLRLNFIEFYNWALSGEGYPFRAFRKKELQK